MSFDFLRGTNGFNKIHQRVCFNYSHTFSDKKKLIFPLFRILGVVIPFLRGLPNANQIWFQCDGASIHRSLETVTAMHRLWDRNRVICRSCDRSRNSVPRIEDFAQNWSANSPDLAPPDQFLFGFMKGKI